MIDLNKLRSLEELMYKTVRITLQCGKVFEGKITSYCSADDSDEGLEDIGIEYSDRVECFDRIMIKSIEEISSNTDISIDNRKVSTAVG